jgi:hypothetical protein
MKAARASMVARRIIRRLMNTCTPTFVIHDSSQRLLVSLQIRVTLGVPIDAKCSNSYSVRDLEPRPTSALGKALPHTTNRGPLAVTQVCS